MTTWTRCAAAALATLGLALTAAARDLVVGQVVDSTGKHGEASRDYVAGAKVFFDAHNARVGAGGLRVRHVLVDVAGDASAYAARIRELIEDKKVDVLFGFVGDEALAAAAADRDIRAGRVALFAPLAGSEAPAEAAGIHFARPSYEAEVRQIVGHFKSLQVTRFAVVRGNDEQGRNVARAVEAELARHQLRIASSHVVARLDAPTPAELAAVQASRAQALILVSDTVPVAEFVKRYRPLDPGINLVTLSTVNHRTLFELLGPALAHGVMITQVVPNPNIADSPVTKEHLEALRTFRDEPPSHLSLEGFIAAKALLEAVRRTGRDPGAEAIAQALAKAGRIDVRGVVVDLSRAGRKASPYVDLAMIRRNGSLLQ